MAEITYQMVLGTLQTAGLLVGIFYYVTTLQNAQKTRELTLNAQELSAETRQAQLFMQIYQSWSSREIINIRRELSTWTWTDYDDFYQKYDEANNPEASMLFQELGNWFEGVGVLVKRKLIDPTFIDDLMRGATLWGWETFGSIVKERRVQFNAPHYYEFWEYLYNEISAIERQHPELAP